MDPTSKLTIIPPKLVKIRWISHENGSIWHWAHSIAFFLNRIMDPPSKLTIFVTNFTNLQWQKRHRADDESNKRKVEVWHEGRWSSVTWQRIATGNFIRIWDRAFLPADLVLLFSRCLAKISIFQKHLCEIVDWCSENQSVCYLETSNLDGETNLKIRKALPVTADVSSVAVLDQTDGYMLCDLPNRNLYDFNATLRLSDQNFSLGSNSLQFKLD